jgi:hypothetical protein
MERDSMFVATFVKMADEAANAYVNGNGKKTYKGLKEYISDCLQDTPISSRQKRDIIDITVKDYKVKMKAI